MLQGVCADVGVHYPKHNISPVEQVPGAPQVAFVLYRILMSPAIKLEDNSMLNADKIHNVSANHLLPPELQSEHPAVAQEFPCERFRCGRVLAELPRPGPLEKGYSSTPGHTDRLGQGYVSMSSSVDSGIPGKRVPLSRAAGVGTGVWEGARRPPKVVGKDLLSLITVGGRGEGSSHRLPPLLPSRAAEPAPDTSPRWCVKIAVCLKRVPDTTAKLMIAAGGTSIDEAGLKFVPNPYDEYALEEALKLREAEGAGAAGETVVVSLGGDATQETMRSALAMGIERGIHLQSSGSVDGLEVARALAAELKAGDFDLILAGKLAVDDYNHQVAVMVAELLEIPCITAVSRLTISGSTVNAEREIEGGIEVSTCQLPAVITCDKGLNSPRLPSLKGIMAAKKKPLEVKPVVLGAGTVRVTGLALPPDRKPGRIVGEGAEAVGELVRLLRDEAKVL